MLRDILSFTVLYLFLSHANVDGKTTSSPSTTPTTTTTKPKIAKPKPTPAPKLFNYRNNEKELTKLLNAQNTLDGQYKVDVYRNVYKQQQNLDAFIKKAEKFFADVERNITAIQANLTEAIESAQSYGFVKGLFTDIQKNIQSMNPLYYYAPCSRDDSYANPGDYGSYASAPGYPTVPGSYPTVPDSYPTVPQQPNNAYPTAPNVRRRRR